MAENLLNLGRELDIQDHEVHRSSTCFNPKLSSSRCTIIKLSKLKHKEKNFKAARDKKFLTYRGTPLRLLVDFLAEAMQARRLWDDIFKVMKEKNYQTRILNPEKLFFRNGEIKTQTNKN